jgi:hypothetical protein
MHEDHIVGKLIDISNMHRAVFFGSFLLFYVQRNFFFECVKVSLFAMSWHLFKV